MPLDYEWKLKINDEVTGKALICDQILTVLGKAGLTLTPNLISTLASHIYEIIWINKETINRYALRHLSFDDRYIGILQWIRQNLHEFLSSHLDIADFAVGQGKAIDALDKALTQAKIQHSIHLFDLCDVRENLYYQHLITRFTERDITIAPDLQRRYSIGIISNVHQYLTLEQIVTAIIYRLYECEVLFFLPFETKQDNGDMWECAKMLSLQTDNFPPADIFKKPES